MTPITGYIVMIGNPFDGLYFEGPFETFEEAEEYIEVHHGMRSCETWIATLTKLDSEPSDKV